MKIAKIKNVGKQMRVTLFEDGKYVDDWFVDNVEFDPKLLYTNRFEPTPKCVHRNLRTLDNFCLDCGQTVKEKE